MQRRNKAFATTPCASPSQVWWCTCSRRRSCRSSSLARRTRSPEPTRASADELAVAAIPRKRNLSRCTLPELCMFNIQVNNHTRMQTNKYMGWGNPGLLSWRPSCPGAHFKQIRLYSSCLFINSDCLFIVSQSFLLLSGLCSMYLLLQRLFFSLPPHLIPLCYNLVIASCL